MLYVKLELSNVPSYIEISSKLAILLNTGTVISFKIQKVLESLPKLPDVVAIIPLLRVIDAGVGVILLVSTKKLIVALADFLDLGTYPIFLAKATIFSLKLQYQ